MARPVVSAAAESLYVIMSPVAYDDAKYDWPLLTLCEALVKPLQLVNDLTAGEVSWSVIMDAANVPDDFLPWFALLSGVELPPQISGEDDLAYAARMRATIVAKPREKKGTVQGLIEAAQKTLTGTKTVYVRERDTSPWHLTINTRTSETPSAAVTNAALQAAKPAGLILVHGLVAGWDYIGVDAAYASYTALDTAHTSYLDLEDGP